MIQNIQIFSICVQSGDAFSLSCRIHTLVCLWTLRSQNNTESKSTKLSQSGFNICRYVPPAGTPPLPHRPWLITHTHLIICFNLNYSCPNILWPVTLARARAPLTVAPSTPPSQHNPHSRDQSSVKWQRLLNIQREASTTHRGRLKWMLDLIKSFIW